MPSFQMPSIYFSHSVLPAGILEKAERWNHSVLARTQPAQFSWETCQQVMGLRSIKSLLRLRTYPTYPKKHPPATRPTLAPTANSKLATTPFMQLREYSLKEKLVIQLANKKVISLRINNIIPFITDNICHIAISPNNCSFRTKLHF